MKSALPLKKPLSRRIGRLMVTVTADGIQLRGYRCRKRFRMLTWGELASVASADQPVISELERELSQEILCRHKADPTARIEQEAAGK